jgi:hypothetical protein
MTVAGYGYATPSYGYLKPPRTPRPGVTPGRSLAMAAAGRPGGGDPFGLLTDTTSSAHLMGTAPIAPARAPAAAPPVSKAAVDAAGGLSAVLGLGGLGPGVVLPGGVTGTAPKPANAYDINTDPALQQANALIGLNDEQATAAALDQKKHLLTDYGDPELAKAVLGASDPTVEAAGQNPFSTRAGLATQRDRTLHDLTEQLNQANLLYSGYRVNQEGQAAHDYQDALAKAAAAAGQGLSGIDANLAGVLAQSNRDRAATINDAYGRHATDPGAAASDSTGGTDTSGLVDTSGAAPAPVDIAQALGLPDQPFVVPGFSTDASGAVIPPSGSGAGAPAAEPGTGNTSGAGSLLGTGPDISPDNYLALLALARARGRAVPI